MINPILKNRNRHGIHAKEKKRKHAQKIGAESLNKRNKHGKFEPSPYAGK